MVTVPENKPEGELCADAFGAVRHCTPCSARLMCPVMSYTEILAFLKKYGLHGKNLHAYIAECRSVTNCC